MRYIENNLLQSEKMVYAIRPHWIVFSSSVWAILAAIVIWLFFPFYFFSNLFFGYSLHEMICFGFFLVGIYWFVQAYIYFLTSEYGVTNKRVLIKIGWIQRKSLELLLDKVEGVLVDQTIFGRIFNYGVITIIGTGGTQDSFPYIPNPLLFRKTVQQQIEIYEEKMHGVD